MVSQWYGMGPMNLLEFTTRDEGLCEFSADAGQVCTLQYHHGDMHIRHYGACGLDLQAAVRRELMAEWGPDVEVGRWASASDVLYVMSVGMSELVGCVAVDRRLFHPFVSHLLVVPHFRGLGHGRTLLDFAVLHVANLGFDEARLWCSSRLRLFYDLLGWVEDEGAAADFASPAEEPHVIMRRSVPAQLRLPAPTVCSCDLDSGLWFSKLY